MKTYRIVITEPAENDVNRIADYIALELRMPSAAENMITKISNSISTLEQTPKRYALVKDKRLATLGIRKLIVDNYIVFFIVSEANYSIVIVRILYSKRNWNDLL